MVEAWAGSAGAHLRFSNAHVFGLPQADTGKQHPNSTTEQFAGRRPSTLCRAHSRASQGLLVVLGTDSRSFSAPLSAFPLVLKLTTQIATTGGEDGVVYFPEAEQNRQFAV